MAKSPPPPELVEAYRLIKADERKQAAKLLKTYITHNPKEPRAWWLMANAVTQPDNVRRCLENVLKLDPTHKNARERLDRMTPPAPPPAPQVSAGPVPDDEPDDSMILGGTIAASPVAEPAAQTSDPPPTAAHPPPEPADEAPIPDPFEELAAQDQDTPAFEEFAAAPASDPFAGPPVDDPFTGISTQAEPATSADDDSIDSDTAYNPFDPANVFDPAAHAKTSTTESAAPAQAAGTGNQPDWGPGLAFVADNTAFENDAPPGAIPGSTARPKPPRPQKKRDTADWAFGEEEDYVVEREGPSVEKIIGLGVIAVAVVVLVGLALYVADNQGWINVTGDKVPDMTTMDGGSFTMKYPKGWDQRCLSEGSGYPVCGVANHRMFNEVAFFAGQDINLGQMIADSFSMAFSGEELPDTQTSIIVMDVPDTSLAYDNGSWAKTKYEWAQSGYYFGDLDNVDYVRKDIIVDGFTGYYYKYTSKERWTNAAWDLYVPHDGIILWLRVDYGGERKFDIPEETVDAMIESIEIKPVGEWR